jgi:histidinol-phosphate/aromatic aminotransferase/cobyric acid decarboxylase-like protein
MTASDAQTLTLGELLAMAGPEDRAAFEKLGLGYTETFGAPALRAAIAATYESVRPEHVLCFAGAEEAIYVAMRVLLGKDDHAVVVTPNYQAAETIPLGLCAVTGVPLDHERGWDLDVDRLRAALRPNTKLVSINFPNNPTGRILPRASLDAIVDACRRQGAWLFSDEVYRLIERDPALRLPQAVDVYERAISLNVMSKAYGLAGLRIGYGYGPGELMELLNRLRLPFNVNRLAQVGARAALGDTDFLTRTQKLVWEGRDYLCRELARLGLKFAPTQANFILIRVNRPGREVYEAMLREGVIIRAMDAYEFPECIRVNVGLPKENERFLQAFKKVLGL